MKRGLKYLLPYNGYTEKELDQMKWYYTLKIMSKNELKFAFWQCCWFGQTSVKTLYKKFTCHNVENAIATVAILLCTQQERAILIYMQNSC